MFGQYLLSRLKERLILDTSELSLELKNADSIFKGVR